MRYAQLKSVCTIAPELADYTEVSKSTSFHNVELLITDNKVALVLYSDLSHATVVRWRKLVEIVEHFYFNVRADSFRIHPEKREGKRNHETNVVLKSHSTRGIFNAPQPTLNFFRDLTIGRLAEIFAVTIGLVLVAKRNLRTSDLRQLECSSRDDQLVHNVISTLAGVAK